MNHAQAMQGLSTGDLSDACDALGMEAVTSGAIKAVHPGGLPLCGPIAPRKAVKHDLSMRDQLTDRSL